MEIPTVLEELNKNAETAFRNIGPIMPIEECEHKWEYEKCEIDSDEFGEWGFDIYRCYRCGSETGIDCDQKKSLISMHYDNELRTLGLTFNQELLLQIDVLLRLLSNYEPLEYLYENNYITQLMVEEYHKGAKYDLHN